MPTPDTEPLSGGAPFPKPVPESPPGVPMNIDALATKLARKLVHSAPSDARGRNPKRPGAPSKGGYWIPFRNEAKPGQSPYRPGRRD